MTSHRRTVCRQTGAGMIKDQTKIICPVCDMQVMTDDFQMSYQGMDFHFCSVQCSDRFRTNPHLYVGRAGHPSVKQQVDVVLKQRSLHLGRPLSETQAEQLSSALHDMMGIKAIHIEGDRLQITYDLLQVTVQQIEKIIEQAGNVLGHGWGSTLKRAFIHYLEETELDNLEQQTDNSKHCH